MQVLFLQRHSTCFGRQAPIIRSIKKLLMMGAWRPKHVECLCRNKTCTVLHQVGVLFDLVYLYSTNNIFSLFQNRPEQLWDSPPPTSLLFNEYRSSYTGIKRPGRDVDPSPTSVRVELYHYSPPTRLRSEGRDNFTFTYQFTQKLLSSEHCQHIPSTVQL